MSRFGPSTQALVEKGGGEALLGLVQNVCRAEQLERENEVWMQIAKKGAGLEVTTRTERAE